MNAGQHPKMQNSNVVAFCHIPKTAGMAMVQIMKYHYGVNYLQTTGWRIGSRYDEKSLDYDFRLLPRLQAIGGHGLRPFLDLGIHADDFKWVTMLRDPVERVISHYVYDVQIKKGSWASMNEWLDDDHGNYQCRWLAGEADADKAIQVIRQRFVSVGLQEHFQDSIRHLSEVLGWPHAVCSRRPVNATREDDLKIQARDEARKLLPLIEESNAEDMKLYAWVKNDLWPQQMACLENSNVEIRESANMADRWRAQLHDCFRACIYKPMLMLTRR